MRLDTQRVNAERDKEWADRYSKDRPSYGGGLTSDKTAELEQKIGLLQKQLLERSEFDAIKQKSFLEQQHASARQYSRDDHLPTYDVHSQRQQVPLQDSIYGSQIPGQLSRQERAVLKSAKIRDIADTDYDEFIRKNFDLKKEYEDKRTKHTIRIQFLSVKYNLDLESVSPQMSFKPPSRSIFSFNVFDFPQFKTGTVIYDQTDKNSIISTKEFERDYRKF